MLRIGDVYTWDNHSERDLSDSTDHQQRSVG